MRRSIVLSCFLLLSTLASAQENFFYLGVDINKPLANTDWINDISARGLRAGYRVFLSPRVSAGLDIAWSSFDQYFERQTRENATGAFTTDYFNYLYSYSATLSGQFHFLNSEESAVLPYVGLGLGATNHEYVMYYNIYSDTDRSWGFLARAEAGAVVWFGERRTVGAIAALHYDFTTHKSQTFGYDGFSALGLQLGIVLGGR